MCGTETWGAMEKLFDQGLVKCIGISNFSVKKTQDLLSYCRIKPAVQQVEIHPCAPFCFWLLLFWPSPAVVHQSRCCRAMLFHMR